MDKINESAYYRMQAYPTPLNYKLSVGFYTENGISESQFIQALVREKFANITVRERDRLVKIYDEHTVRHIAKIRGEVNEKCRLFFYDKINYRMIMQKARRADEGFNWDKLKPVFAAVFSGGTEHDIAPLCVGMPLELINNIFEFNKYVKGILG